MIPEPPLDHPELHQTEPQAAQRYPDARQVWWITVVTITAVMGAGVFAIDAFGKASIVLSEGAILIPAVIFLQATGLSARFLFRLHPIDGRTVTASLAVGLSLPIVANTIDTVLESRFPMPESLKQAMETLLIIRSVDEMVLIVAGLVIGAAVCEELFFRGFLQSSLEWRYGPFRAIGLASLTFTIVHINPWWFTSILVAGVVCGLLAYTSGSVYPGIIVHGMNNGLSLLVVNAKHSEQFRWVGALEEVSLLTVLASVMVLAASLGWFVKQKRLVDSTQ